MIAVTIGIGPYATMARHAARLLHEKTGLSTFVVDETHYRQAGVVHPFFMKLRLFDLVEDEDLMYFDADQVCLNAWDPTRFRGFEGIVCVRDRLASAVRADAQEWGLPVEEYFNAGFFIINRHRHWEWLKLAEKLASRPHLRFHDQTTLNAARWMLKLPLRLLDRRYNWIGFGEGSLCYQVPVFMAHRLVPGRNDLNLRYYEGKYRPPLQERIAIDEGWIARLQGRDVGYSFMRQPPRTIRLREDGTLLPSAEAGHPGYWFVQKRNGRPVLALTSETEVLCQLAQRGDREWISLPPGPPARLWTGPQTEIGQESCTAAERAAMARLSRQRWFQYVRVGYDQRPLELVAGGDIGAGQGDCEERWCIQQAEDGNHELVIGGREIATCRLRDSGDGIWRGRWLVHEKMPVELRPLGRGASTPDAKQQANAAATHRL